MDPHLPPQIGADQSPCAAMDRRLRRIEDAQRRLHRLILILPAILIAALLALAIWVAALALHL